MPVNRSSYYGLSDVNRGSITPTSNAPAKVETNPTKAGSASDRIANLMRAEWDDYLTRFQPRDQQLLGIATGTVDNEAAITRSRESAGGAFDAAQGTLNRDMSRLGLSSMPDEAAPNRRNTQAAKTAAEVAAINGARISTQDRDLQLMSGDMAAGLRSGRLQGGA